MREHASWRVFLPALLVSVSLWIVHALLATTLARGVGLSVGVLDMVFVASAVAFLSGIPIQGIAGLGTVEAWWSLLLSSVGVPVPEAVALSFFLHGFFLVFGALFGIVSWFLLRGKGFPDGEHEGESVVLS